MVAWVVSERISREERSVKGEGNNKKGKRMNILLNKCVE